MSAGDKINPEYEKALITEIQTEAIKDNPFAFVLFNYPWGQKGTPLENYSGPRSWQRDELLSIRDHIGEQKEAIRKGDPLSVYQSATASGRGVGKSALVSWVSEWMASTRFGSSTQISANSEGQLKYKTWGELGVWHAMSLTGHWFEKSATQIKPKQWLCESLKKDFGIDSTLWYINAALWTEENPHAFAGLHNHKGEMVIFDESSGIPTAIWDVTAGFFTEPIVDRFWLCFSNPRANQGSFFDCFHADSEYWKTRNLDSREVEGTDKHYFETLIKKHGEDSDFVRVEVKGEFPSTGDKQFISTYVVEEAMERNAADLYDMNAALIMGVDPARFGEDSTCIRFRQGRVSAHPQVPPPVTLKGKDNMQVADICADLINQYNPDAVCIDAGNGVGVIDRLRQRGYKVHEVWFGSRADDREQFADKRTELWSRMKDWLMGAAIGGDKELKQEIIAPQYEFVGNGDKLKLESKEKMKLRKKYSPDNADALVCTFFVNVAHRDIRSRRRLPRVASGMDFKLF